MATWEEREAHEAETRRRWDRDGLVAACGSIGRRMVEVVEAVDGLEWDGCSALDAAYWSVRAEVEAERGPAGVEEWERAFSYSQPYPEHPGDLYAIDPWSRSAFSYAGLVARERTYLIGQGQIGIVPVERAVMGAVLALSVDLAAEEGWYHPVSTDLAERLSRPWLAARSRPVPGASL